METDTCSFISCTLWLMGNSTKPDEKSRNKKIILIVHIFKQFDKGLGLYWPSGFINLKCECWKCIGKKLEKICRFLINKN